MSWLQHVPANERAALVGVLGVVLGAPTVLLGLLEVPHALADAVAVGAVAIAAGGLWIEWRRYGAPAASRLAEVRAASESDRERDRSIAVSAWTPPASRPLDRLAARDAAFSLPVLLSSVRALTAELSLGASAAAEVVGVRDDGDLIRLDATIAAGAGGVRVHLSRPVGARSPSPDEVPGAWKLDGSESFRSTARPAAIVPDAGVAAARRALAVRDALDPEALEALAGQISAALDAGDEAARPYLTADGLSDLAYWREVGLPEVGPCESVSSGRPAAVLEWIEVGQDGWFDRIEVALGARVLSLRRRTGRAEAPWELWRVRSRS